LDRDQNSALTAWRCLTSIQQEIVKSALQLARIEPGHILAIAVDLDQSALMPRVQAHRLHGALHSFNHAGIGWAQGFSGPGKFEQGVDEVRHLVYAGADFLIQLFALRGGEASVAKKLRVSKHGGQGVTKVERDRTCHASDGGQLLEL